MAFLKEKIEIGVEEAELKTINTFSSFSRKVKWALAILAIGAIPAYFIASFASQKFWLKKYQPGNFTAKPSFTGALAPKISELNIGRPAAGVNSAWAKVSNPNLDLSLDNAGFKFNFYNAQKQLVYTYPDKLPEKFFLLPGQSKYLTAPSFSLSQPIAYVNLVFDDNLLWQKRLVIPKVSFTTPKPQISQQDSPKTLAVEGYFINDSPYVLKQVTLTFKLSDSKNNTLDITRHAEFTVAQFERRGYKQLWPGLSADDVSRVEVTADTDTLNPKNLSAARE